MKQVVTRTGIHGIGQLMHVVHMTDDVARLAAFYERVFGGVVFLGTDGPTYSPVEDRYAALVTIGDLCIEVMAPKLPADPNRPVGRFHSRFGRHLHSVCYQVDDLPGLARHLIDRGVHVGRPGGGRLETPDPDLVYFFPHPRDTAGLMAEMCGVRDIPGDPRNLDSWSSLAKLWRAHPLTIERLAHVTLGVRDLESAVKVHTDLLDAHTLGSGTDPDLGARYEQLQLGDSQLRIAEPLAADSDLGRHVERCGNMLYSLHFTIADPASAVAWLDRHGVRTHRLRDGAVVTDVEDTFGAPIFLSTG